MNKYFHLHNHGLIQEDDEPPSYYQILINSLPSVSRHYQPVTTTISAPPTNQVHNKLVFCRILTLSQDESNDQIVNEIEHFEEEKEDELPGDEPFTNHFDYNMTDNEVKAISDLFSNPLNFKTEQVSHCSIVSSLITSLLLIID